MVPESAGAGTDTGVRDKTGVDTLPDVRSGLVRIGQVFCGSVGKGKNRAGSRQKRQSLPVTRVQGCRPEG